MLYEIEQDVEPTEALVAKRALVRRSAPRRQTPDVLFPAARTLWYALRPWWWKSYFRLRVEGLEHVPDQGPMLLCANHTSHLDTPAILAALPRELALSTTTAAASDVWDRTPVRRFIGRMLTNCTPIERGGSFGRGVRELDNVLTEGRPLILFPEGKRSRDGKLVRFMPGAAMLAVRNRAPIVPIHIHGLHEALPADSVVPEPYDVTVRFGEPIDPTPYVQTIEWGRRGKREVYAALTDELRDAIAALGA